MKIAIPLMLLTATLLTGATCRADNPIIQTRFTADPAPFVYNGTVYLYTSHDENKDIGFFHMKDWLCYTSTDMVNWTDHGAVASLRSFPWADKAISGWGGFDNGAWAPQAVERNGKWYLYCPLQGRGIGVLVADNPFGPFTDPLGKPLIGGQYDSIDPTVFIDDDGQAYLYWGNPKAWYVKLNKDMISFDTTIGNKGHILVNMTEAAFGKRTKEDEKRPTTYEEGPWLYKRKALYYLFFAGGPISEHIGYSTGPTPEGPWKYGGVVMPPQGRSFTNHPGVVDYKSKTYLFYHNGDLPGGGGFKRSVCVDELKFNPDGSIVQMNMTKPGVAPADRLNPYERVEAETSAFASGVETESTGKNGMMVTDINDGDYIRVRNVDFGQKNPRTFLASVASEKGGGNIDVRLDGPTGQQIAKIHIEDTGGLQTWKTLSSPVINVTGVHDLYFLFSDVEDHFNFDWWRFQ